MPAKTKKPSRRSRRTTKRTKKHTPNRDDIRRRAYEIYQERNGTPGNPADDWTRAERELTHAK